MNVCCQVRGESMPVGAFRPLGQGQSPLPSDRTTVALHAFSNDPAIIRLEWQLQNRVP